MEILDEIIKKKELDYACYLQTLIEDIALNEKKKADENEKLEAISNVLELVEHSERTPRLKTIIRTSKRMFLPCTLHTTEYSIKIGESYFNLKSAQQTKNYLQQRLKDSEENVLRLNANLAQLNYKLDFAKLCDEGELIGMPEQIVSDKGIARKVKGGYEIIEFEEGEEIKGKRRAHVKKKAEIDKHNL